MSVGKYSPTVSNSYGVDRDWFEKNGGGYDNGQDPDSPYDDEGYDSYGYGADGLDRAGYSEDEYLAGDYDESLRFLGHLSYESVASEWLGIILGKDNTHTYPQV